MGKNLYEKVFDKHAVRTLESGQHQLLMGLHLIHEVTSPQAFAMLRERGLSVVHPERTFATCDHIIPTQSQLRPFADGLAEQMLVELEQNCEQHGIRYLSPADGEQGVVHVVGPELGLTQPGMTVCCGDSHTVALTFILKSEQQHTMVALATPIDEFTKILVIGDKNTSLLQCKRQNMRIVGLRHDFSDSKNIMT